MSPRTSKQVSKIRQEKKELIMEVSLELFAENGFHATSISKIAKKAGISKGLAYNYFESKKDILDERLANSFASDFLVPENAVKDICNIRIKNRREITEEDVIYLADYFGVSFQAMIYRLNNLKLLSNSKKEDFSRTYVTGVREAIGISEPERGNYKFPSLLIRVLSVISGLKLFFLNPPKH